MINPSLPFRVMLFLLAVAAAITLPARGEDQLITLEGDEVSGAVTAISKDGQITVADSDESFALDRIRQITRSEATSQPFEPSGDMRVYFPGGGDLPAAEWSIDDSQDCHFQVAGIGKMQVAIDYVRGVLFNGNGPLDEEFAAALKATSEEDRIFVRVDDRLETISGLIETLDNAKVVFDVNGEAKSIARDKLYGIVFAMVDSPDDHLGEAKVTLAETGYLWGQVTGLADGALTLEIAGGTPVSIPWQGVERLEVRSDRLVFLSDLDPLEATHQPLLTLKRPWQRDKSVGGRPLTLGEKKFTKGIGVASRSRITFEIGGKFDALAATIGIDAETEGRGDCEFVVLGDGRELFRQRMKGSDEAKTIQVEIDDVQRVTLLVEPGEDLDLADHADWCDIRCVRE